MACDVGRMQRREPSPECSCASPRRPLRVDGDLRQAPLRRGCDRRHPARAAVRDRRGAVLGDRRDQRRARRAAAPLPPRRPRGGGARRARLRAPGERLLRRAAPHRRVAAGAAALHVPGDRDGRLDRARSRARRAAPDRCARAHLERTRPRRRRGGDRSARPRWRGSRARRGVRLQRIHPDQRRSQRARPPAAPLRTRLQRRGGHADDRRGGARRVAPRRTLAGRVGLDGVHRADLDRRSRSASSSPVCAARVPRAPRSSRRSSRS